MNDNKPPLTIIMILIGLSFFAIGGSVRGVILERENIDISRRVQRCELTGRQFHCQENTSWYEEGKCSCSFSNTNRIRFNLSD